MNLCLNILAILSILMVVCVAVIFMISYFENRKLTVSEFSIYDANIPEVFNGFHIVHISDMHNVEFGEENEKLITKVKALQPDVIMVTGDMIVGKPNEQVDRAGRTMNRLCEIAPVYFSMGNHELRASIYTDTYGDMWMRFREMLNPNIYLLHNQYVAIERMREKIHVYGLSLTPQLYRRFVKTPMDSRYLESLFGPCQPEAFHIFMAHNPDYFEDYANWGANLTLSGHVHGGMIRIPGIGGLLSPMVRLFPKYDRGMFQYMNKYMILSGGLGNHSLKIRVNNLPEIVSIKLFQKID